MSDDTNEKERAMRDAEVPWIDTPEALSEYINRLVERDHDYGTCVYAMSMAATAAFQYVAKRLGVSGFQASCADLDILRRTRSMNHGFLILDAEKLLFPQYDLLEKAREWIEETRPTLADEARKRIAANESMSPRVLARMQEIAALSSLSRRGT